MTDDVKIPISTPGATEAARELKNVAAASREVGQSVKEAGQGTSQATRQMSDDAGKAAGRIREGASGWNEWKTAGLAAAAAVGAAVRRVIANMQEMSERVRQDYQSFVGLTQQNDTRALAQIRSQSEARTAAWITRQSATYGIAPEEVRSAAFEIESGFQPEQVGGAAALASMEAMAFKTMRGTGAGGKTVAGLQIAAYEAGLARTPEQFGAFLAKSTAYAGASRMTLQDFGGIMSRLLPMAVNVGLDPDEFQSMAAAMSFRISDPGRLATSLEQLIRAAGAKSPALQQFAAGQGRDAASMGASEVMAFQSEYISTAMQAGGPQGAKSAAEALGIAPELAQVYGVAFDPTVRARMGTLRARASEATFRDVIEGRFQGSITSAEGRTSRAGYEAKYHEQRRAIGEEAYQAMLAEAAAAVKAEGAQADRSLSARVGEAVLSPEQLARGELQNNLEDQLRGLARASPSPEVRRQAQGLLDSITGGGLGLRAVSGAGIDALPGMQTLIGVGQRDAMVEAARFLAEQRSDGPVYNGGTHYHNENKNDPAGKPREPALVR